MSVLQPIIEWKKKQALKRLAHIEYENARGTAQLKILLVAEKSLKIKLDRTNREIQTAKDSIDQIEKKRSIKLKEAIEREIVINHLTEVHGIGNVLANAIIRKVFRGHIADLRRSSMIVTGIGENKQKSINYWIVQYEKKIPIMLGSDFPGKKEIIANIQQEIIEIKNNIEVLISLRERLNPMIMKSQNVISQLKKVSEEDFILSFLSSSINNENLDSYQRGVFAVWEPVPDWFTDILKESQ